MFGFHYEELFEETLSFKRGNKLLLRNKNGNIDIEGWDKDKVKIEARKGARAWSVNRAQKLAREIEVKIEGNEDGIKIDTIYPDRLHWLVMDIWVKYKIYLPQQADINVSTKNGSIEVKSIEGTVIEEITNGVIRLTDIKGRINAETKNGSINLKNTYGDAKVNTKNGSIKLREVKGNIEVQTKNGSIDGKFPFLPVPSSLILNTINGSINLLLPEIPNLKVYASTKIGKVISDFPICTQAELATTNLTIKAETKNGKIRIRKI